MSDLDDFKALLAEIDTLLDSYDPGELEPDRIIREILAERAKQGHILQQAVEKATDGLEKYPYNTELLRRLAYAKCKIVTPEGGYPHLESAEQDLRTILALDPNNLIAAYNLIDAMFTFSGHDDAEVAELAADLAARCERLLLRNRALQIKALGYAGEHEQAAEVYNHWIAQFPESELLIAAKEDADSVRQADR